MDNNTKSEVKEPVKTAKELQKEKWKKFVFGDKANKEPREPLDKQDKLCYAGAVFFLLLALLPTLLRTFDSTYQEGGRIEEEEVEITNVVKKLSCNTHFQETGFIYTVEAVSTYQNSKVQITELKYIITLDAASGLTYEDVAIPEYNNISAIQSSGIAKKEDISQFTLKIDYRLDETLRNNELLEPHNKMLSIQRQSYQDAGYQCVVLEGSL